ncbi:UNVERIFIED_CONTAM: hypothetical protein FKN15_026100 [Acipenser sinensis]
MVAPSPTVGDPFLSSVAGPFAPEMVAASPSVGDHLFYPVSVAGSFAPGMCGIVALSMRVVHCTPQYLGILVACLELETVLTAAVLSNLESPMKRSLKYLATRVLRDSVQKMDLDLKMKAWKTYTLTANLSEMHQGPRVDLQSFRSRYEKIRQAYSKTFPTEEVEEAHVEIAPQSVDINPEPAQWETADQVFTLDLDFLETLTPTGKDKRLTLPKLATFSPLYDIWSVLGDGAEDFDLF